MKNHEKSTAGLSADVDFCLYNRQMNVLCVEIYSRSPCRGPARDMLCTFSQRRMCMRLSDFADQLKIDAVSRADPRHRRLE